MTATLHQFPRRPMAYPWRPRLGELVMVSLLDDRFRVVWHEGTVREIHAHSGFKGRVLVSIDEMAAHPGGEAA